MRQQEQKQQAAQHPQIPQYPPQSQSTRKSGQIVATCRKHWAAYIVSGFFGGICGLAAIISLFALEIGAFFESLIITALFVWGIYLSYTYNYLEMTEDRVIAHHGFFKSTVVSMPIDKIQHIGIQSGIFGKLVGYDTISIVNAGAGAFVMNHMENAQVFADMINNRIDKGSRVFF